MLLPVATLAGFSGTGKTILPGHIGGIRVYAGIDEKPIRDVEILAERRGLPRVQILRSCAPERFVGLPPRDPCRRRGRQYLAGQVTEKFLDGGIFGKKDRGEGEKGAPEGHYSGCIPALVPRRLFVIPQGFMPLCPCELPSDQKDNCGSHGRPHEGCLFRLRAVRRFDPGSHRFVALYRIHPFPAQ